MEITIKLSPEMVQQLNKKRGHHSAESFLSKNFQTAVKIQRQRQAPSWLGDIDAFETELSNI
tara:strand:+ start:289 stop:474 length:186 start_codon:yes stop_codon:yes gene_type:complete